MIYGYSPFSSHEQFLTNLTCKGFVTFSMYFPTTIWISSRWDTLWFFPFALQIETFSKPLYVDSGPPTWPHAPTPWTNQTILQMGPTTYVPWSKTFHWSSSFMSHGFIKKWSRHRCWTVFDIHYNKLMWYLIDPDTLAHLRILFLLTCYLLSYADRRQWGFDFSINIHIWWRDSQMAKSSCETRTVIVFGLGVRGCLFL